MRIPPNFNDRELLFPRGKGPWKRLHHREYSPLHFGKKRENRFDDPEREYGVLYLAEDEYGAFVEVFLREPEITLVDEGEVRNRLLCSVEAKRELKFVDLTGGGLQAAGVRGDVSTGSHPDVQAMSRAIYEHPAAPDGIRYHLYHDLGRVGIAVFDRVPPEDLDPQNKGCLLDPPNKHSLGRILDHYKKALIH